MKLSNSKPEVRQEFVKQRSVLSVAKMPIKSLYTLTTLNESVCAGVPQAGGACGLATRTSGAAVKFSVRN